MSWDKFRHKLVHRIQSYDPELRMLILSAIIGIIGSFAAIAFRYSINWVYYVFFTLPQSLFGSSPLITILAPTLGGLIVGTIIFFSANEAKGHGIPEMIKTFGLDHGIMRVRVPFVELLASAITIGAGGSSGREGPIAYVSGALGSMVARFFDLKDEQIKTLALAGVAAGISATFNAPIGGVLFGVEIIRRNQGQLNLLPLITSSVVAVSISEFFLGPSPAFIFPTSLAYTSHLNIPFFIILGAIMGLFSIVWIKSFYFISDFLFNLDLNPILLAGIGGIVIGLISLFVPEIRGVSYGPINSAFALEYTLRFVLILVVIKLLATSITLGSGMSGGVAAPTLFLGVMLGTAFGYILQMIGLSNSPVVLFAFLGMGALFAATMRAPLTAVVLMSEMVKDFQLIIPLMFAVSLSWIISRELSNDDIFTLKLSRMGVKISQNLDVLEHLSIEHIMTTQIDTVSPKDRLEELIELMRETRHTGFPVIEDGKLYGIITEHDVNKALDQKEPKDWVVGELCTKHVTSVIRTCPISVAFLKMVDQRINRFPVIESNEDHTLVGWVTRSDLMRAYRTIKAEDRILEQEQKLFEEVDAGDLLFKRKSS